MVTSVKFLLLDNEPTDPVRVDNWPGPSIIYKTISISGQSFVGQIVVQASLMNDPGENDWFDIFVEDFPPNTISIQNRMINSRDCYIWMRVTITKIQGRVDRVLVA